MALIGGNIRDIQAILVSHEHMDHIMGAGIISRRFGIPLYANQKTWEAMRPQLNKLKPECVRVFSTGQAFSVGDLEVHTFPTPHDAAESVGFNVLCGSKRVQWQRYGHMDNAICFQPEGADMVLIESNHDIEMLKMGRYPWYLKQRILGDTGHLCNEAAGEVVAYLAAQGTQKFLLGHLSAENNFPELAFETVKNELLEKSIIAGKDVYLSVAYRDRVSEAICV